MVEAYSKYVATPRQREKRRRVSLRVERRAQKTGSDSHSESSEEESSELGFDEKKVQEIIITQKLKAQARMLHKKWEGNRTVEARERMHRAFRQFTKTENKKEKDRRVHVRRARRAERDGSHSHSESSDDSSWEESSELSFNGLTGTRDADDADPDEILHEVYEWSQEASQGWWTCDKCPQVNKRSQEKCEACRAPKTGEILEQYPRQRLEMSGSVCMTPHHSMTP